MTYLRTNTTHPNALNWSLGFRDIEKQLDTLLSGLPGFFESQEPSVVQSNGCEVKLRWYEKPEAYLVRIDLPGVRKEDISIELEDGTVSVSAIRKFESGTEGKDVSEVTYAKAFRLPDGVPDDRIAAGFESGVLSLTLQKSEKLKPRQISIS